MIQQQDIEQIIKRYGTLVRKIAESNVKNHQNTDDIFQETFIKVLEHKDELDCKQNIRAYITRVAFNTVTDYSRKKHNLHEVPIDYCYDDLEYKKNRDNNDEINELIIQDNQNVIDESNDNYSQVRLCIDRLPVDYSNVITCIYYREMTIEETAQDLRINEITVRTRLYRAKEMLRKYKEKYIRYGYVSR